MQDDTQKLIESLRKRYGTPLVKGGGISYSLTRHPLIDRVIDALSEAPATPVAPDLDVGAVVRRLHEDIAHLASKVLKP